MTGYEYQVVLNTICLFFILEYSEEERSESCSIAQRGAAPCKYEVTEFTKPALGVCQLSDLQRTGWHVDITHALCQDET